MSTLILFLPPGRPGPATEYSYTLTADGHHATGHASAPAALLPEPARPGAEVVAVVPARALSWQRLLLPPGLPLGAGQQTPRLRSALEGLLEDRVLDDVGQLHFAIEPGAQVGQALWVAVCDRDWLRENLQALEAAGRRVARVVPEFAPGPTASAGPELCALGTPEDAYLVLSGQGADQGVAVLPLSRMALALAQTGSAADQTPVLRAEPAVAALAERTLGQSAGLYTASQRALDAARSHWDLAQFDLASSGSRRAMRKAGSTLSAWLYAPRWRAARWGAGLLALTQLAGLNVWAWHERQTLAAKQAAVHAVLTQTFAQVQVVANAPVQMENELARLRQAAGSVSASDLEPMLAAADAALPAGRLPTAIEYSPGALRLRGLALVPDEASALSGRLQAAGYQASVDDGNLWLRTQANP
ncbi:type II secretion system protein GspL [Verminephrobacter eiseniae]|uniref:type II secretion system protein GspL n=1 Tax=Verminephrobacter eiseniae TaxID=364317 RepID=UPI002238DFA0|nr:type II secretion system protein GspL [Verminephrobacter eiseniae]MCW5231385.1 general secretion pathway protein GspL [Verminephrobacter eiseniae]MCW5293116.1 general secretion pathway protein GspL [Verminephrobacter eiseniae]MCW8187403.1 general secretion pathway protein GspL [Verminephrobacter eiseniae]MCW8225762.1 general secretion pathway protein GspL [Verminephrobacter eiseniae]MCW8236693.1 general secretion pathway protein GspL [Verminephrobacter eiseniae]